MTRNEVVEEIKNIVLNYNVNSSIDIDSNIIYIEFGNNNKIEIEGFDSDNVYLLKYTNNLKKSYILKYNKAPYKLLVKLFNFLNSNISKLKLKSKKF